MGDPGNPSNPNEGPGPEPDPDQPGWASPDPPPPAPASPSDPTPRTPPAAPTEPVPQAPPTAPAPQPAWGAPPPVWGSPPPGAPVPPGGGVPGGGDWTPGPAPKKRRLTWLWILIPVLFVFVASTVVVIVFVTKLVTAPIQTTNDYYADLRDGRYTAAYGELCSLRREEVTLDDFTSQQRSQPRVQSFDFDNIDFSSNRSDVDVVVKGTVTRNGFDRDTQVGLWREHDHWKVCTVSQG